ncbi:MAG: universal stress protein, partial [Halobacteria archaeon]|nr:universal stress protein [Halobacteria archaeon]
MTDTRSKTLVPVEVLEGESVPQGVVELLSNVPVFVLGYHEVPEQTAPDQARSQFGEKANAKLDEIVEAFEQAGAEVESRLVFTQDSNKTLERVTD